MRRPSPIKDPPWRKKADRPALAIPAIVGFVLFSSTLLLCDVSGVKPNERWPWLVDRLMAVPVEMTDVSDLRYYAIPVGLAVLLLSLAWRTAPDSFRPARRLRECWFEGLALVTVAWACASAWKNGTWDQSRGWVFSLSCGVGWAALLGRVLNERCIQQSLIAGSAIAGVAGLLSLAHRQGLGERFFQLPVGPITLTASLGAMWGAIAIVWCGGAMIQRRFLLWPALHGGSTDPRDQPSIAAIAIGMILAASSLPLLWAAGRRGAWLGLLAGGGVAAGLALWTRFTTRKSRVILIVTAITGLATVGVYVRSQVRSPEKVVSGPLKLRSIYWEKMFEMMPRSAVWGFGPDQFVVKATTALARRRAEEPRVLHGTVDYDGHNEWLQAAFELGIPGGAMYLALPIGALTAGWRRWRRSTGIRRVMLLALTAGLVAVCVSETSSINLRYPILWGWYWTIVGLMLALGRGNDFSNEVRGSPSPVLGVKRIALRSAGAITAIFIVIVVGMDIRAALHHAKGRGLLNKDDVKAAQQLELATGRFGASRWLSTRTYLGDALSSRLRILREAVGPQTPITGEPAEVSRRALEVWSEIYRECPGYLDTGFRLADAQRMAGDLVTARKTLDVLLSDLNPYDRQGNLLQIEIGELGPSAKLECVRRVLRQEMWEPVLLDIATKCFAAPDFAAAWSRQVEQALHDVALPSEKEWQDPLAPETLRIEAFRLIGAGDLAGAERVQFAAARAYDRLARDNASVRRMWPAEADAWYLAARFLFDLDPANYTEAFDRISRAESFVIEDVPKEAVPNADPKAELVGGRFMPLDLPDKLSPLWRFSAMMHMAMKRSEGSISLRITWSLPSDQRSPERTMAELGMLAAELVKVYASRPEASRPPSYPLLVNLARQYGPH